MIWQRKPIDTSIEKNMGQEVYEVSRVNRKKKKSSKRWLKITLSIIAVILLAIIVFLAFIFNSTKQTINKKMHEPIEAIDTSLTKKRLKSTKPLNVLLLGIDSRSSEKGRSDAIMVMQLQPDKDKMEIVSIPRDARAEIIGKGFDDKINHAYAFGAAGDGGSSGGAQMAAATVENFLDIDLDYYVTINMDGLVELVNELGSITVNNEVAWSDSRNDFPIGPLTLDGAQTEAYVRMRKKDPAGDFGRTTRQRKVIEGILNEGASLGSIPKFNSILEVLGNNLSTNLDFDDMVKLFTNYSDTRRSVNEHMITGEGKSIDGIYYLIVPDSEIEKAHDILTKDNPD